MAVTNRLPEHLDAVKLLRMHEKYSYQVAYAILRSPYLAESAAMHALLAAAKDRGFPSLSFEQQRSQIKTLAMQHALEQYKLQKAAPSRKG